MNFSNYWYSIFSYLDYPPVLKEKDAEKYEGDTVYVIGIYQIITIQRHKSHTPINKVGIRLLDGCGVHLYSFINEKSIRSEQEIQTFEGRLVKVKGVIYPFILSSQLDSPSLTEVFDIELIDW